ncbi:cytochrome c/FTR1 family iron permease [uncultured Maricaulis sp.]|uniref:cytochrome c/FTR1 family iron permease n=1 Tax=uncultured Maricaulis sp. TaxID=174710 RepID=UPI0030DBBDF6|tara:strand:+ start:6838 stop:8772 length:1935 start_codon:yes stop_codon:yes gene_type:complete
MRAIGHFLVAVFAFATIAFPPAGLAQETAPSAQVAWRLLDYLAVDYPEAVSDGQVLSQSEYAEMQEFSASVRDRLAALPPSTAQPGLVAQAEGLVSAIGRKAPAPEVADRAQRLASALLLAYPTQLAPSEAPDLARGAALYAEQCAACHGVMGHADGPAASGLDPRPIAFADAARARQRSLFGLYQVIYQGLDGTAMASFAELPPQDRWALAFYAGSLAFDETADQGERLWTGDARLRARFPDLQALTQTTPAALAAEIGEPAATNLTAYLRRHPEAVSQRTDNLGVTRTKLAQSLASYEAGDRQLAQELALSAYLDGFEPVEPTLAARDRALLTRIESAMGAFRASVSSGAPLEEVRAQVEQLGALMDAAEAALAPEQASPVSSFAGAFTILLREGVEALLIVVAMIAFLGKADRRDVLPYVHGGWISALVAGVLTWVAATSLISISGASRELTEGFGSLLSAVVLISVGIWMHGKSRSDAWQDYIKAKLSTALSRGSAWFLFSLAFVVVYREVFETILFFVALWSQGAHLAMLAGAATAALALALVGWGLLSYSKRLPISQFFSYSSMLIAALAVVLAGKGFAGLQEAGLLGIHPVSFVPRIDILGVFPTWEGLAAQGLALTTILVGFWWGGRKNAAERHGP